MKEWFGSDWPTLGQIAVSTVLLYAAGFVGVRLAGRRTLAQLSAFDVLITIVLGTIIGSTALSTPTVAEGTTALVTLLLLQTVIGAARQRVPALRRVLDFPPEVIARDGALLLRSSPLSAQLTPEELYARLRMQGVYRLDDVAIVVLEPSGAVSVVPRGKQGASDVLTRVLGKREGDA